MFVPLAHVLIIVLFIITNNFFDDNKSYDKWSVLSQMHYYHNSQLMHYYGASIHCAISADCGVTKLIITISGDPDRFTKTAIVMTCYNQETRHSTMYYNMLGWCRAFRYSTSWASLMDNLPAQTAHDSKMASLDSLAALWNHDKMTALSLAVVDNRTAVIHSLEWH